MSIFTTELLGVGVDFKRRVKYQSRKRSFPPHQVQAILLVLIRLIDLCMVVCGGMGKEQNYTVDVRGVSRPNINQQWTAKYLAEFHILVFILPTFKIVMATILLRINGTYILRWQHMMKS